MVISANSKKFFELWAEGIDAFLDFAKANSFLDKIIVNAVFWAQSYDDGTEINGYPTLNHDSQEYIQEFNALLSKQYAYLSEKLSTDQFIHYPQEVLTADPTHKWGKSPFHYSDALYEYFLNEIDRISFSITKKQGFKRWQKKTYYDISEEQLFKLILENETALYSVNYDSEKVPLDIMCRGFNKENLIKHKKILVSFNGAITNRSQKSNPFFTLMDLSTEIDKDLPFISFSDPSLYLSRELSLAWYNGNYLFTDLVATISRILDKLINTYWDYGCELVLCGGSGGGYAVLNILNHVVYSHKISALIWNPQVSLSEYNLDAFKSYLSHSYPNLHSDKYSLKSKLKALMNDNDIVEEVAGNIKSKVLVLMNDDDHKHIFKHLSAFLKKVSNGDDYIYGHNYIFLKDNLKVVFGSWGEGHAVPHRSDLKYFLQVLLDSQFDSIVDEHPGRVPLRTQKALNSDELLQVSSDTWLEMLSISYDRNELMINIDFNIDQYYSIFNLVYYVVYKGAAIKSSWNTKRTKLSFRVEGYPPEELKVRIYIRDIFGNQRIISKDVCSSNNFC